MINPAQLESPTSTRGILAVSFLSLSFAFAGCKRESPPAASPAPAPVSRAENLNLYPGGAPIRAPDDFHPIGTGTGFSQSEAIVLNDALFLLKKVWEKTGDPRLKLLSTISVVPLEDEAGNIVGANDAIFNTSLAAGSAISGSHEVRISRRYAGIFGKEFFPPVFVFASMLNGAGNPSKLPSNVSQADYYIAGAKTVLKDVKNVNDYVMALPDISERQKETWKVFLNFEHANSALGAAYFEWRRESVAVCRDAISVFAQTVGEEEPPAAVANAAIDLMNILIATEQTSFTHSSEIASLHEALFTGAATLEKAAKDIGVSFSIDAHKGRADAALATYQQAAAKFSSAFKERRQKLIELGIEPEK
jgi:hypothetical protein